MKKMDRLVSLTTFLILLIVNTPLIDADKPAYVTDAIVQLAKPLTEYCKNETNITDEQIKKVNTGNFEDGKIIGCYSHCLWQKMDLLDENDNVKTEVIEALLPDELKGNIVQTLLTCQKRNPLLKNDKCARSLSIQKCYFETSPQVCKYSIYYDLYINVLSALGNVILVADFLRGCTGGGKTICSN